MRPNEYWQIDATVIRLTTGIRIYLQAVIDNFSRRILAWRVSDTLSSATTRELLIEASKGLPDDSATAKVTVVTDGGSENFGEVDHLLKDSSSLRRVLAQIDIISSNSLIEAFWRQLKHAWLFLNTLDSAAAVRRLVAFYVREHNEKIPRAVLGARTPDEVYFSREENALERLSEQRKTAQKVRSVAIEQQPVVIAVNRHAQALLSEVSPEQGLVENLLGNLHDVCVSSTANIKRRASERKRNVGGVTDLQRSFLDAYEMVGTVTGAAREIDLDRNTHYW